MDTLRRLVSVAVDPEVGCKMFHFSCSKIPLCAGEGTKIKTTEKLREK